MNPRLCPTCGEKVTYYTDFNSRSGLFDVCHCDNGHQWPFKFISIVSAPKQGVIEELMHLTEGIA